MRQFDVSKKKILLIFLLLQAGGDVCDGDCCEQNQTFSLSVHASRGMFCQDIWLQF